MYGGTFPYYNVVPYIGLVPKRCWHECTAGSGKLKISKNLEIIHAVLL